ncbi:HET-domain-containing protein [Lentithecium fluviatile CBS 122367]|uniref:HET-domain-containing protein n=1 Tax=Lentithecium fluviatile CBS 122367 TaxID=1168545 RepID=A0A6G1IEM8_9PLEO|nr:HET-domain-containing protein [Lentithecium fluviatile CBS 122367]
MPSPLCKAFRQIPGKFFSAKYDNNQEEPGRLLPLTTIAQARYCASSGCTFCTILMANADTSFLPEEVFYTDAMILKRAMIDPEQSFQLFIGKDDFSRTFFYRVPPEWRLSSLVELDKPLDELVLMRTWLSNCLTKHSKCTRAASPGFPKRLLDIRAFASSDDIKLVEWQSAPDTTQYVTLSHCWGPTAKRPICTTKATLSYRMQRIRFEDLSVTFKDAIKICRDLDQKYLWIDSLCIIQDDEEDWSKQAASMASIYGGSYVTLAALSSADSTQGCRIRPRDAAKPKPSRYQDFNFGSRRVRLFEHSPAYWHSEYGDDPYRREGYGSNPLRTRAWTLQERELSLRCINFAQGQLLWQCRTMKGSSEIPWLELIRKHDDSYPLPLKLNQGEDFSSSGPAFQRDHWNGLVEDYSSRHLTNETDKLPALAGLASKFSEEQKLGNYLAGIWSNHLPSALLWKTVPLYSRYRDQPTNPLDAFLPRRPQVYRAPSWSWASIDGEISYESQRISDGDDPSGIFDSGYGNFEITGSYYQLAAKFDPLDTPSDAALQMRGNITELEINMQLIKDDFTESFRRLIGADGTTVGALYPDIIDDIRFVRSVFVLSIRSEPFCSFVEIPYSLYGGRVSLSEAADWNDHDMRMGLALLQERPGNVYRRIGLVRWVVKEVFGGTQPVELRLV